MPPKLLSEEEIAKKLTEIPQWTREEKQIKRKVKLKNFLDSMGFVTKVAILSERMDHHPDILIQWNRVTLTLSTHSAGGLTDMDFILSKKIDEVLEGGAVTQQLPKQG